MYVNERTNERKRRQTSDRRGARVLHLAHQRIVILACFFFFIFFLLGLSWRSGSSAQGGRDEWMCRTYDIPQWLAMRIERSPPLMHVTAACAVIVTQHIYNSRADCAPSRFSRPPLPAAAVYTVLYCTVLYCTVLYCRLASARLLHHTHQNTTWPNRTVVVDAVLIVSPTLGCPSGGRASAHIARVDASISILLVEHAAPE